MELPSASTAKLWLKIIVWAAVYYFTSALSGVYNKWLIDGKTFSVSPTFLTWVHLIVALCADGVIMRMSTEESQVREQLSQTTGGRSAWDLALAFGPIAFFIVTAKLMTYVSYQHVSIALSHTAKASEPIFNVIVAAVLFGEWHSPAVYASLLPITLGILMASVSELSYNHYGFAIAAFSALMKVLQNIFTKKVMSTGRYTFWEVHLYCGAASLAMMVPWMYASWVTLKHAPYSGSMPILGLLVDALLQWASSVSAYVVLSLVAHLTATIINTFKRMVMITSGSLLDPTAARLTPFNLLGVLLATLGIFLYNMVKDSEYLQQQIQIGMGRATQSLGLHVP
jgi:solute carrier family 35 protein E1